jgi:protein involved in polysaccharide export with SLBB domain
MGGMRRLLVVLCLAAVTVSCQSEKVTRLNPFEFVKHFTPKPVVATVTTNTPAAPVETAVRPRLIVPGTVLTVTVAEDRSLNRQYMVPLNGQVEFAATGRLNVLGLLAEEVARKIREPLERDFFQKATVEVTMESPALPPIGGGGVGGVAGGVSFSAGTGGSTGSGGGVVYVLGSINRPGPLMLPPNEVFTLTKVIIAAGNFSMFGNGSAVRLIRYDENGRKFETRVNVTRIMKEGMFEDDVPVQSGDWIIVGEKWISF